MAAEPDIEFVMHTGDLVSDGRKKELWPKEFFTPAKLLTRNVPFYPVLGNHEFNSVNYYNYFSLPGIERFYSFDLPDIHIIALDSNISFDMESPQYRWLMGDLTKNKDVKWKFIIMHHPTYSSGPHGGTDENGIPREAPTRQAQELLPGLAKEYGIQAIFAGHDHAYERSVNENLQYIITGGGGAENYGDIFAAKNPYRKIFYSGLHYCTVSINGDMAKIVAKTPGGRMIDSVDVKAK